MHRATLLHNLSHTLVRAFPTPELLSPPAAGVDISDASVKWLVLGRTGDTLRVRTFGEEPLESGIVVGGEIRDVERLASALRVMKDKLGGIVCAHAALPEEPAYVFESHVVEGKTREEVLHVIEFDFEGRVPIPAADAVFDYDIIQKHDDGLGQEISVAVFPRKLSENYADAFERAGMTLLSLEIEARSIARAVCSGQEDEPITLLVDFGRARTGFAVLKRGIPIFTSTVEVGGDAITKALQEKFSFSVEQAIAFRNEHGLVQDKENPAAYEVVMATASALSDEIVKHFHYWDTRRNDRGERMTPVGQVILMGGSANLMGLTDYISGRVQGKAQVGDVWRRVCDFDEYIPPIGKRESLQYATAIGLALRASV